jgi:predicted aspartyl protease
MVEVDMGKVVVPVRIVNQGDRYLAHMGHLPPDQVRGVDVPDALVDTGATGLMVPSRYVKQLGLRPVRTRTAITVGGTATLNVYEPVQLTVQGRECFIELYEIGDHLPVLIGQMPLEALDWVVDCQGQRLVGNPAHGGEHMIDALGVYG